MTQRLRSHLSLVRVGRYLYYFTGTWVDLDERKRPKNIPRLFGWATPQGWRQGLRPGREEKSTLASPAPSENANPNVTPEGRGVSAEDANALVRQIAAMSKPLGWRLYRGLLKKGAGVWNLTQIRDADVLKRC